MLYIRKIIACQSKSREEFPQKLRRGEPSLAGIRITRGKTAVKVPLLAGG
jgi:hypothetical protein